MSTIDDNNGDLQKTVDDFRAQALEGVVEGETIPELHDEGRVVSSEPFMRLLPRMSDRSTAHNTRPIAVTNFLPGKLSPAEYRRQSKASRKLLKDARKLRKGKLSQTPD